MTTMESRSIEQVVDSSRYPLRDPGGAGWNTVVSRARRELREHGCSVLPGFVRSEFLAELRDECAAIAPSAYYDVETVNVYNAVPDDTLPADHPVRISMERGNAFVPRDTIPESAIIHRLYRSPLFRHFLATCVDLPAIHELADPLAGLCLNVVNPGRSHPWHFDTNEFAISMLTQEPDGGGVFEYCPNIRSASAENLDDVRAVLTGRGGHLIRRMSPRAGDLQLFRGRYSLHRVGTVTGRAQRHSAIFAYSGRPGVLGTVARTRQLFGRVAQSHLDAEGRAVRVDQLLD
ncbi:arpA protein [Amycolatopsis antarctica]|uniref:ArpA protein n=1 Tax=Amycolatopsis antarctica TaxID=1854586 RepID=A0A263D0G1_9PSEU|nr:arpA protein [Amycolatopsis antarctica]OZM71841.1 arpA protein [Amycolatopsis antarctica]